VNALLLLSLFLGQAPTGGEGSVATVAGTGKAELNLFEGSAREVNIGQPFGVELDQDGGLYICEVENHRVLRLDLSSNRVVTVAGNGKKGYAGDGGNAREASLNEPYEVRLDREGNLYVVEMENAVVRRVDRASKTIRTVAGTGVAGFSGDGGPAVKAQLRQPHSIALDGKGSLFIADIGNHRIRRVNLATGAIDSIAGNGEAQLPDEGAEAAGKPIKGPRALYIHGTTLWIALREGHSVWTLGLDSGKLSRAAGSGQSGWKDGGAAGAAFDGPKGIAVDPTGSVFIMDTENQAVRRLDPARRVVETVAGAGPSARGGGRDGGPPLRAMFDRPHGIAAGGKGVLYVGDTNNHRVRRIVLPAPR